MVAVPGSLKQVSVGGNQLWGVNKANDVFMTTSRNGHWKRMSGSLTYVSVSNNNNVWGVSRYGQPYRRDRYHFQEIRRGKSGGLKQISVGAAGVWGVNKAHDIYYRQGTRGDKNTAGSDWIRVPDKKLKWISSGNRVFGVDSNNEIFERVGRSDEYPIGRCWRKIGGSLAQIDVGIHRQWGVDRHGDIYIS